MDIEIETLQPNPSEAIVLRFDFEDIGYDEAVKIFNSVKYQFPENIVIAIPNNVGLQNYSKDALKDIVNMISEIINSL